MQNRFGAFRRLALVSTVFTLGATAIARSQTPQAAQARGVDDRWDAWLGCWQPTTPSESGRPAAVAAGAPLVCVARTNASASVEISTLQNGAVLSRDTIEASGQQHVVAKQGCNGWQRAQWSADARRLFLHSELTCAGNLKRIGTGILAIAPTGEWLDVQGVTAGGNAGVRVTHYRTSSSSPGDIVPGLADIQGRPLAISAARIAAGAGLAVRDIAEAVKQVDTAVVQAWIAERGASFELTAKHLVALADAGVPGSVTDVMVGVSYPERFALDKREVRGVSDVAELSPFDSARAVSRYINERCFGVIDPLWYTPGIYDPCASRYGYRGYTYGYGYGLYGRGYGSYGYGGIGYSGYYAAPVVVVKSDEPTHGKVVKGVGYTPGRSSGSGSSGASSSSSGSSGSGSSASSSGSGSSGSGSSGSASSGSSSGGGGRTAIPRPPSK